MKDNIIGFQWRTLCEDVWYFDATRAGVYLLNSNVKKPLSVDDSVWPSIEYGEIKDSRFGDFKTNHISSMGEFYTIKDVGLLLCDSNFNIGYMVCITSPCVELFERIGAEDVRREYGLEDLVGRGWKCLGYDVADGHLLSGLSNCGYSDHERKYMSEKYTDVLNRFGLINDIHVADNFRMETDKRVPEHAPFYVYGLWGNGVPY